MLSISTILTLYVLIPLPMLAILVYFVSSNINKRSEQVQNQLSITTTISQESFSGIKIIKAFGNETNIWKSFLESCKSYTYKQIQLVPKHSLPSYYHDWYEHYTDSIYRWNRKFQRKYYCWQYC